MLVDTPQSPTLAAPDAGRALEVAAASRLPDVEIWGAIHTQARAEKVVAAYLEKKRVRHYLPLTFTRRVYGARVRHSWIPLFPGYLFYDAGVTDTKVVYASKRVARILRTDDPALLRADLANLAGLLEMEPDLVRTEIHEPGTPVEVVSGPYVGARGEFVRRKGETVFVICVHFIGYGAELAIDESCVKPLDPDED